MLLTGANGFIGSHILASLIAENIDVVAAVRDPEKLQRRFPGIQCITADLNRMLTAADWTPHLAGVDAVINCAGVLQSRGGQNATHIHATAPIALFDAARLSGVKKVIQISAVGQDADTEFARTKSMADDHLAATDIDWTILRPSIVYGQQAYGGTAMLRALAAMPFVVPTIGDGSQASTPIHVNDLCRTVLVALREDRLSRVIVYPCGPETLTLKQMIATYRGWLGLAPARFLSVPKLLINIAARLGDWFGSGPITTTSVKQLEHGTQSDAAAFERAVGFKPLAMQQALMHTPSGTGDLWHARFYLLRPVVRVSLIILWLLSAISGLVAPAGFAESILVKVPALAAMAAPLSLATSVIDLGIAAALLFNWRPKTMALVQLAVIAGYTLFLTLVAPGLWLAPFGELLKNVPILALVLASLILAEER